MSFARGSNAANRTQLSGGAEALLTKPIDFVDVDYLPPEVRSSSLNDRFGTVSG
jgi:hypothetical protein